MIALLKIDHEMARSMETAEKFTMKEVSLLISTGGYPVWRLKEDPKRLTGFTTEITGFTAVELFRLNVINALEKIGFEFIGFAGARGEYKVTYALKYDVPMDQNLIDLGFKRECL